jgi:hypothetical protein
LERILQSERADGRSPVVIVVVMVLVQCLEAKVKPALVFRVVIRRLKQVPAAAVHVVIIIIIIIAVVVNAVIVLCQSRLGLREVSRFESLSLLGERALALPGNQIAEFRVAQSLSHTHAKNG